MIFIGVEAYNFTIEYSWPHAGNASQIYVKFSMEIE